jgi:iron complex outermembrane receptor protein
MYKGFDASLTTQYVSKQYMNNAKSEEAALDAYCISNANFAYTFRNIAGIKALRLGFTVYNIFNHKYYNNGYAGAGYYLDDAGNPTIYRYAGYAAQAPAHVMGTVSLKF